MCAAPLPHPAKQCSRCKTLYCSPVCQAKHWKEGGHDKLCKKIKKNGGAEQFHANEKYAAAVTVAAEACAEDTKGQTCYICTEALHWKTKEGIFRGCACRGTAGFAHVSCLTEQVKILVAEAEENNLGYKALNERVRRWYSCSLCEQDYHGVVCCALGWAGWKTYVGRPEADELRGAALSEVANGLSIAQCHEDALAAREAYIFMLQRIGGSEENVLTAKSNLANTYEALGRGENATRIFRDVYSGYLKLQGEEHGATLIAASNYAASLEDQDRNEEAKSLLRKTIPVAQRILGESHEATLKMKSNHARALYMATGATLDDLREAVNTLEETERTARRVLGLSHPVTRMIAPTLRDARAALSAREESDVNSLGETMEAMAPRNKHTN